MLINLTWPLQPDQLVLSCCQLEWCRVRHTYHFGALWGLAGWCAGRTRQWTAGWSAATGGTSRQSGQEDFPWKN